jgi:transposase
VPDAPTYEQLLAHVVELERVIVAQTDRIAEQSDRIAELERKVGADSSNSSRPPSSDAPWAKKSAPKRSSRTRSGRKAGKQPGAGSVSRRLVDDPDETFEVAPDRCGGCGESLDGAPEVARVRRQVADVSPPPPKVTEYQLVSRQCRGCGQHNAPAPGEPRCGARRHPSARPIRPVRRRHRRARVRARACARVRARAGGGRSP